MLDLSQFRDRTGLLVSVRSAAEAEIALTGGADVVDIKEPTRGPLGAADADVIASIADAVAGRAPITAAAGELLDWPVIATAPFIAAIALNIEYAKFGLAGCNSAADWPSRWR